MTRVPDDVRRGGDATAPPRRRPGGRSARVRVAVLDATLGLMRERGNAFTIPHVAARAGVHETTIYRRWGSREALIVDAIASHVGEEIPIPDSGSLRGDITALLASSRAFLMSPLGSQLVRATAPVQPAAPTDSRRTYWPRRLDKLSVIFERAIARGEIAPTADVALATELLLAPLYFRLLITDAPLDPEFLDRLATFVLAGARSARPAEGP